MMQSVISQINATGSINASWVLVIVSSIAGTLALIILNDMRVSIKSIIARQDKQQIQITETEIRTEFAHERIDKIEKIAT